MAELPGKALAEELAAASRDESRTTPIEDVIAAARSPGLDDDAVHRLVSRLWVLERMFYYVYGGWGQGLEINDFPASIKYLFSKQIVDESTHEMLYLDTLLRRGCVKTQKEAFQHPYGGFSVDSGSPITSSRCAISRPIRTRSASPPSISARRSSSSPGWRRWPR